MDMFLVTIVLLLILFGITLYFVRHHYRKRVMKEFKRAQKSDQLKTLFLTNVSHSLRTPLNAINEYSKLIMDENDSQASAQVKEMSSNIQSYSQQMQDFIAKLLELSKFEGGMSPFTHIEVNLAELMASYRREALSMLKPDVLLRVNTDMSPHCKVTLDANGMHLLMMHLLSDAALHTKQGDITITYTAERKGLRVNITYGGQGQAEMISEDIYSFLQRDDALRLVKDNSVLGLSICKAIIDFLEGFLDMDMSDGRKTVVSFWFPCKMRDCYKPVDVL
jgi:K+-sensing histidine kinase KdpD